MHIWIDKSKTVENQGLKEILLNMLALHQEMREEIRILSEKLLSLMPDPVEKQEPKLTRKEAIAYLSVGDTTFKRMLRTGMVTPIEKPGGQRFDKKDLDAARRESIRRGRI